MKPNASNSGSLAVVGLQWGDEGKGKIVDLLAPDFNAIVRYNGGANAGHSVVVGDERFALHLIPSGVFRPACTSVIGNGVVVDPAQLLTELDGLAERGVDCSGVVVSDRAHVVMPYHKVEDAARERALVERLGIKAVGTTGRGIGPAYAEKVQRSSAIRMGDLLFPDIVRRRVRAAMAFKGPMLERWAPEALAELEEDSLVELALGWGRRLAERIADTSILLHRILDGGGRLLFEGANATLLDVDHGTYPFVTSSNSSALGIGPGSGVPPQRVGRVVGVAKAYQTRVGAGPMPTELTCVIGDRIRERGREYGTTTGRPRRIGWLDLVALRYAVRLNGVTEIAVTLLDVLSGFESIRLCTAYTLDGRAMEEFVPDAAALDRVKPQYEEIPGFSEEITAARSYQALPATARAFIERIERGVGVPVTMIGVGPDRDQTIHRTGEIGGA
ncbi:MAG TPA: adenylosuccinate synthase [Phycisphaerales bacterium]|nr:adenylosuccinate synthase [Phycisphaerales bacterium]